MIRTLNKVGLKETYTNIIKAIYKKLTYNIKLNGKKLKAFPLRSGARQGCPLSTLLINIIPDILAAAIRQIKGFGSVRKKCHCLHMAYYL